MSAPELACPSRLPLFQGSSVCQVTAVGVTVILLYTSRACYNLFTLSFSQSKNVHSFDYDWYNVSDQVSGHTRRHPVAPVRFAAPEAAGSLKLLAVKELGHLEGHSPVRSLPPCL